MTSYSALPEPMLARSGQLPTSADYAYELKWDGFRCLLSTEGRLGIYSRRRWNADEGTADPDRLRDLRRPQP